MTSKAIFREHSLHSIGMLCIMMHSMMNRIYILLDERWQGTSLPEAAEAVRAYRGYGFDTDLWIIESGDRLTDAGIDWSERDTLCVADGLCEAP